MSATNYTDYTEVASEENRSNVNGNDARSKWNWRGDGHILLLRILTPMTISAHICYGLAVAFLGPLRKLGSRTPAITRFDSNENYFAQRVADTSHYRELFAPHVSFEERYLNGKWTHREYLTQNPVREASPISTKPKNAPRAFTAPQAAQLMAALTYDDQAIAVAA
jgi:hypothetical protein